MRYLISLLLIALAVLIVIAYGLVVSLPWETVRLFVPVLIVAMLLDFAGLAYCVSAEHRQRLAPALREVERPARAA